MSSQAITVTSLQKSFPTEIVLQNIDLEIERGEFCVVVGPSGCGKSTLLKCIAGLMDYDSGSISLNGTDAEQLTIQERNLGYVFQEFEETLFPHKTVSENVAFGLRQQNVERSDEEIESKIDEMLSLLAISETKDSVPSELSGGQQQRVELARQLVRECEIMLLDDPLADLDYKLQKRMELEMRRLHRSLGSTFLYVTHNQDQALKLADKLVVMNQGKIEQIGTPSEVYHDPKTAFVGRFVGDSNGLTAEVTSVNGEYITVDTLVGELSATAASDSVTPGASGLLLTRPEQIDIVNDPDAKETTLPATLSHSTYTGETTEYVFSVDKLDEDIHVQKSGKPAYQDGVEIYIGWDAADATFYDQLSVTDTVTIDDLLEI